MSTPYAVSLTQAALADLDGIVAWLAQEAGTAVAEDLLDTMLDRVGTLKHFPTRGVVPLELLGVTGDRVRQMSAPPYRLFYEVEGGTVLVFAIVHARRDLAALLQERLAR